MVHIEGDLIIRRNLDTVFDFAADERNEPLYNPRMVSAEKMSEGLIGPGTRFRTRVLSGGRRAEMTIEIVAYDRPRRLASLIQMSSMEIHGTLTFGASGGDTRMHWSWDLKPLGFFKLMTPLLGFLGRRQENRNWTSMKRYLEAQESRPQPA